MQIEHIARSGHFAEGSHHSMTRSACFQSQPGSADVIVGPLAKVSSRISISSNSTTSCSCPQGTRTLCSR